MLALCQHNTLAYYAFYYAGIFDAGLQSVEKSAKYEIFKFHNYLVKGLSIDLKTFLGLAMPNQCSQTDRK